MSQGGRGRGRGRGAYQPDTKRPGGGSPKGGEPSSPTGGSVEDLVSSLNTMSIDTKEKDIALLSESILKLAVSTDKQELAKIVYQKALEDWRMSRALALLSKKITEDPKDGHTFRSSLLPMIQNDYNKRDDLRKNNKTAYLGCIAFLCQIYANLRNEKGESFFVLLDPVYKATETLLDNKAEEDEMMCAAHQLFTCGKMMQLSEPTKWRGVIQAVRDIILDNRGSRDLRRACIDLVEVAASEWKMQVAEEFL